MTQESNPPTAPMQLPHYVYVLADPRTRAVFYVGKGQGTRVFAHWAELKREIERGDATHKPKQQRLREIAMRNEEPLHTIVGRYETAEEALSVEATLINWVYGFDDLTNLNRGFNGEWVRPKGDWSEQRHLDAGVRERVQDGSFRDSNVQALAEAGAYDYLNQLVAVLRGQGFEVRDFGNKEDRPYDPGESNGYLGVLVAIDGVDFMVNFSKTKTLQLWVANTASTRSRAATIEPLWPDLGEPLNIKVAGAGRYRPLKRGAQRGSLKFPGPEGFAALVAELRRRQDGLLGFMSNTSAARGPSGTPVVMLAESEVALP